MKAIVYYTKGSPDVLRCEEIEKPVPSDGQVLVRVRAASLNPADRHIMRGAPAIVRKIFRLPSPTRENPGRTGRDVAGVVEAVGANVAQFKPGDEVFGNSAGACAEYVCGPEAKFVLKPDNVTFEEAAACPVAAFTALQGLRDKGHLQPGQRVLINGASGGVGTFAVQIAKSFGAHVTGVCSTRNLDLVRSIGADEVIDYTKQDFTETDKRYHQVFDCVWTHSLKASGRILEPGGTYVIVGGPVSKGMFRFLFRVAKASLASKFGSKKFLLFMANANNADLIVTRDLLASGKLKPIIDRRYPLEETPDAMRYLEEGHARGKVIITVV
jgi:NADPH:quinone reductase-like Zn-dependent oxidoreductase